jgi:hypothetical protein
MFAVFLAVSRTDGWLAGWLAGLMFATEDGVR